MSPTPAPSPTPPDNTIPVVVQLQLQSANLPAANTAEASIPVVLTDSAGNQTTVSLDGTETPDAFAFAANIAAGKGTLAIGPPLDTNGQAIGTVVESDFDLTPEATYLQPTGATVTAVASSLADIGRHVAAARRGR